jgi:hypothetical protein
MKGVSLEYGRRQVRPMRSRFHPSSARGPASCYGDHGQSSGGRERGCELRRTPDIAARGAGSPLAIAIPGRNVARVVGHGQLAMTEVSIWAQALGVVIGVLLSSAFVVLLGWFIGVVAPASVMAAPGGGAQGPCRRSSFAALRELAGSPARKLVLLLPNEVITTGMTDLACAYRAGAVDRAVDD